MSAAISLREPADRKPRANNLVREYLREHLPIYRELAELRRRGWDNEQGDAFFQKRRQNADYANAKTKAFFFNMMRSVGAEMDRETSALTIEPAPGGTDDGRTRAPAILDLCMAPGGFSTSAIARNPTARLRGISLPRDLGGHEILIPGWEADARIQVSFRDITMLAAEMGAGPADIPADHPDARALSQPDRPFRGEAFDLVFCDGQVLRTHGRAGYREDGGAESGRLLVSQLVLALQRIREGGTLVALLHKADAWDSVSLLHAFSSFSDIALFKPRRAHRIRSSFYLIARRVRPGCAAALGAVEGWKAQWRAATLGMGAGGVPDDNDGDDDDEKVAAVLAGFGPQLVELERPIFAIQAEALREASFAR